MPHVIPGTSGRTLSPAEIYQLILIAGAPPDVATNLVAIALAESGRVTNIGSG